MRRLIIKDALQFNPPAGEGSGQLIVEDSSQPASESVDRSEADSEIQASPVLRRSSMGFKRREIA